MVTEPQISSWSLLSVNIVFTSKATLQNFHIECVIVLLRQYKYTSIKKNILILNRKNVEILY